MIYSINIFKKVDKIFMTELVVSAAIGYGLGQLSPANLLSKIKHKDLRENGTGNLGGTNAMIVFGKVYGLIVIVLDVLKAFFAIKIAKAMFSKFVFAGLVAGCFAVIGHIFPFYMHFHGGKGVAAFSGMILAFDIRAFVGLFLIAVTIMLVTNVGYYGPISAAILFPLWVLIRTKSFLTFGCVAAIGGLVIYKHKENMSKRKQGKEISVNEFLTQK